MTVLESGQEWQLEAACRGLDSALFVPVHSFSLAKESKAKSVCRPCSVRVDCLSHALGDGGREPYGVWGGLSESERRHLLKRRPGVSAWRQLLETAIAEYDLVSVTFEEDFAELFQQQFHRMVGFLITAGARCQDAEDAVQMAFVELARHWSEVCERVGWLRQVAHRMWWKIIRKGRPDDLVANVTNERTFPSSDEDLIGRHHVLQLLGSLPEQQRIVLAFAYDGCSPSETAEALGVPAANVRQNLRRAKSALARLLAQDGAL